MLLAVALLLTLLTLLTLLLVASLLVVLAAAGSATSTSALPANAHSPALSRFTSDSLRLLGAAVKENLFLNAKQTPRSGQCPRRSLPEYSSASSSDAGFGEQVTGEIGRCGNAVGGLRSAGGEPLRQVGGVALQV